MNHEDKRIIDDCSNSSVSINAAFAVTIGWFLLCHGQILYLGRPAACPGISTHGSWTRAAMVLPGTSRRWEWSSRADLGVVSARTGP
jgi:hypothetical protein